MTRVACLQPDRLSSRRRVEVPTLQIDADDAVGDCEVLYLMERGSKLEHPALREHRRL